MNTQSIATKEFSQYDFSPTIDTPESSSFETLDDSLKQLHEGAKLFAGLSIDERIELCRSIQKGYINIAERSVKAACKAKGIKVGTPMEGEEWATGPFCVVRQLRLIRESLLSIKKNGNTPVGKVGQTLDDNLSVQVFPTGPIDGMLFKDVRVDVHMQPGVTRESLEISRASFYKKPAHDGRVVMVLGAGNIASIPAMDVLTKMFNEGKVCILKMNPVNAYLGPFIEEAFSAAISRNFFMLVYGGAEEGEYLANQEHVDEIHITGSDKTHDTIIWGPPGAERTQRMTEENPVLNKEITSELGNISPVIIVPGPYSDKELKFQAEDLAASFTCNSSFLCCVPVIFITCKGWDQREKFLDLVEKQLAYIGTRKAYYPGAKERWETFTKDRPDVKSIGRAAQENTSWALIRGLDATNPEEPLFQNEPFSSILAETVIDAADPVEFTEKATEFANNKLWGTLTANIIVHPTSMKDDKTAEAVERMIVDLRYGTISVNTSFSGLSFSFGTPPWGGYPGSALDNIQSGRGWVHNAYMLEGIEKTVARFPLTAFPKPFFFPSHKTAHKLVPRLIALEENGSWLKLPPVLFTAMRG